MTSRLSLLAIDDPNEANVWRLRLNHLLSRCYQLGATDAEVDLQLTTGFTVSIRDGQADSVEQQNNQQLELTVYMDQRKATVSTTDLTQSGLQQLAQSACDVAQYTQADPYAGLAEASEMAQFEDQPDLGLYQPWSLTIEQAIERGLDLEKQAVAVDERLSSEQIWLSTSQSYSVYTNSRGFYGVEPNTMHDMGCVLIARDDQGRKERDLAYSMSRNPHDLLSIDHLAQLASQRTLARLNSRRVSTVKAPVLFLPRVAQEIISSFMAAISGGRLYREVSFLQGRLGERIFPESISIRECPHLYGGLGSAYFDDDGMATYDKFFVQQGYLQHYCLSVYSARRLGMTTTANAGGFYNLVVEQADAPDYEALIKRMDRGLIEIQYPVSELTIAGSLPVMFQNISAVGGDVDTQSHIQTGSILVNEMTIAGH